MSQPDHIGPDDSFEVQVGSGGPIVPVPRNLSIIQALAGAGVMVGTSCEQGICGTCLTGVLDGQPLHRDQFLTPDEQAAGDQMLLCCSRSRSPRLVLDL